MIEVNLLPGAGKRTKSAFSFSLPSFGGGGGDGFAKDPYKLFFAVGLAVSVGYMAMAWLGASGEAEDLQVSLDSERQDSVRFADLIQRTNQLAARGDSIARRVAIIQDIDAGRYVWPHVLDEVAAAVPEYTWLREVLFAGAAPLQIRVNGRAGSIYAITNFMRRLEASRFLRAVTMDRAEQQPSEENQEDLVYVFELLVTYEPPPFDELETVPLFDDMSTLTASPGGE